jgi:hypothetical protein
MARPKGSKNKPKDKPPAKAKAKVKPPAKAEPPDWLRKAMAVPPRRKGRPPGTKNNRPKIEPQQAKAKRGKKPMATKPHYDPLDDPDLRAGDAKGDAPIVDPKPPGGYLPDNKPGNQLPGTPDNTLPGGSGKPDQSLPGNPIKPGKPAPLPGGGVAPDNALPEEPEPEPLFDEVAAGEAIPPENAQALIGGTLGGGGDHHADAKRILERMANEANWLLVKGPDDTPAGKALKAKREAREKAEKEAEKARKDAKDKDAKGAKKDKAAKEGEDARG